MVRQAIVRRRAHGESIHRVSGGFANDRRLARSHTRHSSAALVWKILPKNCTPQDSNLRSPETIRNHIAEGLPRTLSLTLRPLGQESLPAKIPPASQFPDFRYVVTSAAVLGRGNRVVTKADIPKALANLMDSSYKVDNKVVKVDKKGSQYVITNLARNKRSTSLELR